MPERGIDGFKGWRSDIVTTTMQKLPESVRTLWRRVAVLRALLVTAMAAVLTLGAVSELDDLSTLVWALPVAAFLIMLSVGWWWANAKWQAWSFELNHRWVTASRGVFTRRTVTIPRNRVQTVTTNNGPLDRYLNLTTVTIHTAGIGAPNLLIPHLEDDVAQWLRAELGVGVGSA